MTQQKLLRLSPFKSFPTHPHKGPCILEKLRVTARCPQPPTPSSVGTNTKRNVGNCRSIIPELRLNRPEVPASPSDAAGSSFHLEVSHTLLFGPTLPTFFIQRVSHITQQGRLTATKMTCPGCVYRFAGVLH